MSLKSNCMIQIGDNMKQKQINPQWYMVIVVFLSLTIVVLQGFLGLYNKIFQNWFDSLNVYLAIFIGCLLLAVCLLLFNKIAKTFLEKMIFINLGINFFTLAVLTKAFGYFLVGSWAILTVPLSLYILIGKILEVLVYYH